MSIAYPAGRTVLEAGTADYVLEIPTEEGIDCPISFGRYGQSVPNCCREARRTAARADDHHRSGTAGSVGAGYGSVAPWSRSGDQATGAAGYSCDCCEFWP